MDEPQEQNSGNLNPAPDGQTVRGAERCGLLARHRISAALVGIAVLSLIAGFLVARTQGARGKQNPKTLSTAVPFAASAARATGLPASREAGADNDELARLTPQLQSERLLERALHHDEAAVARIEQQVDGWRGRLQSSTRLFELVTQALDSDDLRVRAAAVELDLAANDLSKTEESEARLVKQLQKDPAARPMALFRLGALGSRGVDPEGVLAHLLIYAKHRNEDTRYWAVEGLAMLGTDETLNVLVDVLHEDPSPRVRECAAYSLARAGMLTGEQRLSAVPDLLNLLDDDGLDSTTRGWIYQALRTITRESLGNDAGAWREWWAHHDSPQDHPRHTDGLVRA